MNDRKVWVFVSKDFSETPGPRRSAEGDFSGEEFLQKWLLPRFEEARENGCELWVDLDGVAGYATSFLEESFGGLARKFGAEAVLETVQFKSNDQQYLPDEIRLYIHEANG